jgi:8-oxo-dGTP pyrophosphatase MutT (NUDIX family)
MAAVEGQLRNLHLLDGPGIMREYVVEVLAKRCGPETLFRNDECQQVQTSSVMMLLAEEVPENGDAPEICLVLNKRSREVVQPGDLCFPGGRVKDALDSWVGKMLAFPGSTLARWPCWKDLKRDRPDEARFLSLLLAAALRESWEEMRLNPFSTRFLGPLPSQCLVLFKRVVHPMVGWLARRQEFKPSWEVEKIFFVPLRSLVDSSRYACYRLYVPPHLEWRFRGREIDFPCFLFPHGGRTELLWGVTYRIVTLFLELVFGFVPPGPATLPLVPAPVDESYINGRARKC